MAVLTTNAAPSAAALPADAPPTGVIHIRHQYGEDEPVTLVGNDLLQHPTLSATAIGVGVYLQSLPDSGPVSVKALAAHFQEGEAAMRRAVRELEAAGYLSRGVSSE